MKDRLEKARREYAKIPKYGFARPPKAPTDLHLVTAFFHEDLRALQRIPNNKANARIVRRALLAAQALVESAATLQLMRYNIKRAKAAQD